LRKLIGNPILFKEAANLMSSDARALMVTVKLDDLDAPDWLAVQALKWVDKMQAKS
jgi:hypothetical protein